MADLIPIPPVERTSGSVVLSITMAGIDERGLSVAYRLVNGHLLVAGVACLDQMVEVDAAAALVAEKGEGKVDAPWALVQFRDMHLEAEGNYRGARARSEFRRRDKTEEPGPEPQPWPDPLDEAAWYGLAGEIARCIEPHTEADPVAVLVTVLLLLGDYAGHGPHVPISGARHTVNEFACIVGSSARARKGSSLGHPLRFMRLVDPLWVRTRKQAGLSSGEGLVNAVRDAEVGKDGSVIDAGASDKRLMVVETEFASVLRVMTRDGNTLSMYIREAWDDGNLSTLTKHPMYASDAHISILGHATQWELRKCLEDSDGWNGFANRFLWIAARQSKWLEFGGGEPAYGDLVRRAHGTLLAAQDIDALRWGDEAAQQWSSLYRGLTRERTGRLAAATSRGEAHIVRLAALYAVLDMTDVLALEHLDAALALWSYAEQSARWLFGDNGSSDDADTVLDALGTAGEEGMNRTQLYAAFGGRIKATALTDILEQLLTSGRVLQRIQSPGGKGRKNYVYFLAR